MAKIPTELYICVPRRSSYGVFHTNIWANLTRKDTGEEIEGKPLFSYLNSVNISKLWTGKLGYAGPFDINPQIEGLYKTWVEFKGDAEFEPCKSEEITLKVDPNLGSLDIHVEVTLVAGDAPLTIQVTGFFYPRLVSSNPLVPLELMVFDSTSTKRLQSVKEFMTNSDGTYAIEYTFTKPGTYSVFVNFLGDEKYRSAWSNNGATTKITVTGGDEVAYLKVPVKIVKDAEMEYRIVGPSDTEPTPAEGYMIDPEGIEIVGTEGKFWIEFKITDVA